MRGGIQIESWGPFAEGRNDLFSHSLLSEIGAATRASLSVRSSSVADAARRRDRHTEVGSP